MSASTFKVIIQDSIMNLYEDKSHINNQHTLALANYFERGEWREDKLLEYLFNNMKYGALSYQERKSLIDESFSTIKQSANNLRIDDKGGEIAEIFLHGIMKDYYKALSILPKIFYKQSSNLYANGADSVHIVVNNNDFTLWLGEAKFYVRIADAIRDAVESVNSLLENIDGKLRKEFQLIVNHNDLRDNLKSNTQIYDSIKYFLEENNSLDNIIKKIHVPICILHGSNITKKNTCVDIDYFKKIETYYNKKIPEIVDKIHFKFSSYSMVHFYIIIFPVPDKSTLVENFNNKIKNFRNR